MKLELIKLELIFSFRAYEGENEQAVTWVSQP